MRVVKINNLMEEKQQIKVEVVKNKRGFTNAYGEQNCFLNVCL